MDTSGAKATPSHGKLPTAPTISAGPLGPDPLEAGRAAAPSGGTTRGQREAETITPRRFARVIVDVEPAHLDRPFDYRIPEGVTASVGQPVKVTIHGRRRHGWIVDLTSRSEVDDARILPLTILSDLAVFDDADLGLFRWVARRYAAPLAHVLRHALPARIAGVERDSADWGVPGHAFATSPWSGAWNAYNAGALLKAVDEQRAVGSGPAFWWRGLPGDDTDAMLCELIATTVADGRGVVVLSPDPRSPLLDLVMRTFRGAAGDHRSGRANRTRYRAFLRGRSAHNLIAVGERGGVFAPVPRLGLMIVDDEANPSYKELRSPRHHAREVALARARMAGAVCVMRSDLPSAALWRLLQAGHVTAVSADRGQQRLRRPRVDVVDLGAPKPGTRRARFSAVAHRGIAEVVSQQGEAIVLAARGGIGAALACTRCGQRRECPVCAGSVRPHDGHNVHGSHQTNWQCPSCGWTAAPFDCRICGDPRTAPLAAGAGRLTDELQRSHRDAHVLQMEGYDAPGPSRRPAIAVMTRGSVVDRPEWLAGRQAALVVAPDADGMLSRPSVDASEDTLRLWFYVARLAGHMILQTREPDHPAVQSLVRWDPEGFWAAEAPRRHELGFPPALSLVRVSAPAGAAGVVRVVGEQLRTALPATNTVIGPTPDGVWLVKTAGLWDTLAPLYILRQSWDKAGSGVRIDVDPVIDA